MPIYEIPRKRSAPNGRYIVSTRPGKKRIKVHLMHNLCWNGRQVFCSTQGEYYSFNEESELDH